MPSFESANIGHLTVIADGQIDLALMSIAAPPSPLIVLGELAHEPMVFVCAPTPAGRQPTRAPHKPHRTRPHPVPDRLGHPTPNYDVKDIAHCA